MIYINHRNEVNQAIRKAKCDYYITLLEKADVKVAFSTVNRLLASPSPQLPDQLGDGESLCEKFASFFTDKIDRIRAAVDSVPVTNFDLNHNTDLEQSTTNTLNYCKETSETEVGKIIKSSKSTTCSLDRLPTKIINKTSSSHIPALTRLINTSFESGIVPVPLKKALVTPCWKSMVWTLTSLPTTGLYPTSHLLQRWWRIGALDIEWTPWRTAISIQTTAQYRNME